MDLSSILRNVSISCARSFGPEHFHAHCPMTSRLNRDKYPLKHPEWDVLVVNSPDGSNQPANTKKGHLQFDRLKDAMSYAADSTAAGNRRRHFTIFVHAGVFVDDLDSTGSSLPSNDPPPRVEIIGLGNVTLVLTKNESHFRIGEAKLTLRNVVIADARADPESGTFTLCGGSRSSLTLDRVWVKSQMATIIESVERPCGNVRVQDCAFFESPAVLRISGGRVIVKNTRFFHVYDFTLDATDYAECYVVDCRLSYCRKMTFSDSEAVVSGCEILGWWREDAATDAAAEYESSDETAVYAMSGSVVTLAGCTLDAWSSGVVASDEDTHLIVDACDVRDVLVPVYASNDANVKIQNCAFQRLLIVSTMENARGFVQLAENKIEKGVVIYKDETSEEPIHDFDPKVVLHADKPTFLERPRSHVFEDA